jgi:glyoxylase-like metal-dependent hydrolase (beta-lactamase superfamily II)/uncharacterized protein with ACT and thioredoxin-like domain
MCGGYFASEVNLVYLNPMEDTKRHLFIAGMPDVPGALERAAAIISGESGNINRLHFDRKIDPTTVFFEVTATDEAYERIMKALDAIGYLRTSLPPVLSLKFVLTLPNRPGALLELLGGITVRQANVARIEYDDRAKQPERLLLTLTLEDSDLIDTLMQDLQTRYPIEIIESDRTGRNLDDTVFYLTFAQEIRNLIGDTEDEVLMQILGEVNHIVQDLTAKGRDAREVFNNVLKVGKSLRSTSKENFYADVQVIPVDGEGTVYCFQPPCGGNVFLIDTPSECVMVDTGYGIYHEAMRDLMESFCPGYRSRLSRIVLTHADADHCGAAGYYGQPCLTHPGTIRIIEEDNRAFGSVSEDQVAEWIYTKIINLFSGFMPPRCGQVVSLEDTSTGSMGTFRVIGSIRVGKYDFSILESHGGHIHGMIYLVSPETGIIFASDTILNLAFISPERTDYNLLAVFLVSGVNVDPDMCRRERQQLMSLAQEIENNLPSGKKCMICGGHGPVSVISGRDLVPWCGCTRYAKSDS